MRLLDACLALVLTLALFASSVTMLVEALHFILDSRAKALKGMLDAVFDQALKEGDVKLEGKDNAEALRKNFFEVLGTSRTLAQLKERNDLAGKLTRGALGLLDKHSAKVGAVCEVSLQDVLHRFSRTELAKKLGNKNDEVISKLQTSLDGRYSQFEQAASEYFRTKSRNLAFVVGILLALTVNIDAVRMFDAFLADPTLTARTIEQMRAEPKTPPETPASAADAPASKEARVRDALEWAETSRITGFPVGWAYYPYCTPPGHKQVDLRCLGEKRQAKPLSQRLLATEQMAGKAFLAQVHIGWQGIFWLISAIATGFLIGLGGPYWFDLAVSLGSWRDMLRGSGKREGKAS